MALFQFTWLRNILRKNMSPIPEHKAFMWKNRLTFAYVLLAWNALGFVCYQVYVGNSDWAKKYKTPEELALTPAQQWARTLKVKDAKVYSISGLNMSSYEIHNDFDEKKPKEEKAATDLPPIEPIKI